MSKKRQRLGKGIEALLGEDTLESLENPEDIYAPAPKKEEGAPSTPDETDTKADTASASGEHITHIPLERIQPGPWQPRRNFDQANLEELAQSIKSKGLLQPVLVCPYQDGYALIAGERRWRACRIAGLERIPALVRKTEETDNSLMALIENIQRADLDPLEIARGLDALQKRSLNHQEIAGAIGMARSSVTNMLRLLSLPEQVKQLLGEGEIEMGHARALLTLDPDRQLAVAHTIAKRGLSVRQAEQLIRQDRQPKSAPKAEPDPDVLALQKRIGESLGARVAIKHGPKGKGELRIGYDSTSQFNTLLARLAPDALEETSELTEQVKKPAPPEPPRQLQTQPKAARPAQAKPAPKTKLKQDRPAGGTSTKKEGKPTQG